MPILGALAGGAVKKLAGKAIRWATKGKLIGSGGGKELAKTVVKGTAATVGTAVVTKKVNEILGTRNAAPVLTESYYGGDIDIGEPMSRGYSASGRRYRRMNPMNSRALKRAVRRVNSAEKLFRQVFSITKGTVTLRKKRRSY